MIKSGVGPHAVGNVVAEDNIPTAVKSKPLWSSLAGCSESYSKRWKQYYQRKNLTGINKLNYFKKLYVTYEEPLNQFRLGNPIQIILVCWRELLAEFLGTCLFIFIITGGVVVANIRDVGATAAKILAIAMNFGFSVIALVSATANVSGGHLNPAVTLGVMTMWNINQIKGVIFVICQLLGGIAGSGILYAVTPKVIGKPVYYGGTSLATNETSQYDATYTIDQATGFGIELVLTFIFVWVVLAAAKDNRKDIQHLGIFAPFAIGTALMIVHFFGVPLTGPSVNPARSLGPAVVSGFWDYHYIYWAGPLLGGFLAALAYRFLFSFPNPVKHIPPIADVAAQGPGLRGGEAGVGPHIEPNA